MAAEPAPGFTATDLFGSVAAASKWITQSASTSHNNTYFPVNLANGDNSCEAGPLDVSKQYTAEYLYCGADIKTDTGLLASAFGTITNGIFVDTVSISWSNTAQPALSVTGHQHFDAAGGTSGYQHTTGAENKYAWDGALPATGGVGIGVLAGNYSVAAAAIPTGVTAITDLSLSASANHTDVLGSDGLHFAGISTGAVLTLNASGIGLYSEITLGSNWATTVDDYDVSDSNSDFDTWSLTAHLHIART